MKIEECKQWLELAKQYNLKSFKVGELQFEFKETFTQERFEEVQPAMGMDEQLNEQQAITDIQEQASRIVGGGPEALSEFFFGIKPTPKAPDVE